MYFEQNMKILHKMLNYSMLILYIQILKIDPSKNMQIGNLKAKKAIYLQIQSNLNNSYYHIYLLPAYITRDKFFISQLNKIANIISEGVENVLYIIQLRIVIVSIINESDPAERIRILSN